VLGLPAGTGTAIPLPTVNRMANFNANIHTKDRKYSSLRAICGGFAGSNLSIDDALEPTLSPMAPYGLYTYLIDTATVNGNVNVIAQPEKAVR